MKYKVKRNTLIACGLFGLVAIGSIATSLSIKRGENTELKTNNTLTKSNKDQKSSHLNVIRDYFVEIAGTSNVHFEWGEEHNSKERILLWASNLDQTGISDKDSTLAWNTTIYKEYSPSEIIQNWDEIGNDIISKMLSGANDSRDTQIVPAEYGKDNRIDIDTKYIKILKEDLYTNEKETFLGIKKVYIDTGFLNNDGGFDFKYYCLDATKDRYGRENTYFDFGIMGFNVDEKNVIDTFHPQWSKNQSEIVLKSKNGNTNNLFVNTNISTSLYDRDKQLFSWKCNPNEDYKSKYAGAVISLWNSNNSFYEPAFEMTMQNLLNLDNKPFISLDNKPINKKYIKILASDILSRDVDGMIIVNRMFIDSGFINGGNLTGKYYIADFSKQFIDNKITDANKNNLFGITGFNKAEFKQPTYLSNIEADSNLKNEYISDVINEFKLSNDSGPLLRTIEDFILRNHKNIIKSYIFNNLDNNENHRFFRIVNVQQGSLINNLKVTLRINNCYLQNQSLGPNDLSFEITKMKWLPQISNRTISVDSQEFKDIFDKEKGFYIDWTTNNNFKTIIENRFNEYFNKNRTRFIEGGNVDLIKITTPFKIVEFDEVNKIVAMRVSYTTTDGQNQNHYNNVEPIKIQLKSTPKVILGLEEYLATAINKVDVPSASWLKTAIVEFLNSDSAKISLNSIPNSFIPETNKFSVDNIKINGSLTTVDEEFINIKDGGLSLSVNQREMPLSKMYLEKTQTENENTELNSEIDESWWIYVAIGGGALIAVIAITVIIIAIKRKKSGSRSKMPYYY